MHGDEANYTIEATFFRSVVFLSLTMCMTPPTVLKATIVQTDILPLWMKVGRD